MTNQSRHVQMGRIEWGCDVTSEGKFTFLKYVVSPSHDSHRSHCDYHSALFNSWVPLTSAGMRLKTS